MQLVARHFSQSRLHLTKEPERDALGFQNAFVVRQPHRVLYMFQGSSFEPIVWFLFSILIRF